MSSGVALKQRVDIQILRAVAVLSVVIFHFWPPILRGGFAGVDVFFVISGFLITSLLVREIHVTGRVNLLDFWVRRIRRIFPVAIVVIVSTVAAVMAFGSPRQLNSLASNAIASTFSAENFLLWWESTNYDARDDATSPFQHYWSLAVEEQFYLVWPLVLFLVVVIASRFRRSFDPSARFVIVVLAGLSFADALWGWKYRTSSYFDPFARAWELGLGAFIALTPGLLAKIPPRIVTFARPISWIALVAVFVPGGLEKFVPGFGVLPATFLAAIIIALPQPQSINNAPIAGFFRDVLVWIGDRSFSIYLWHWPLVFIVPFIINRELSSLELVGVLVATLVLSDLSYRFVENPIRRSAQPWLRKPMSIMPATLGISLVVAVAMAVMPMSRGVTELPTTYSSAMASEAVIGGSAAFPYVRPHCEGAASVVFDCVLITDVLYDPFPDSDKRRAEGLDFCDKSLPTDSIECLRGDATSDRRIALVGDSKAGTWRDAINQLGQRAGFAVEYLVRSGCGFRADATTKCERHNRVVRERLVSGQFDLVIIAQAARTEETSRYVERLGDLVTNDVPVVVIKDNAVMKSETMDCVSYNFPKVGQCEQPRSVSFRKDPTSFAAVELGVPVIDFSDIYCDANYCAVSMGGYLIHRDDNHMFPTFVTTLTPFLWSDLRELGYFTN